MIVIKLFSVILTVHSVLSLHSIEDKFLTKELIRFFDDVSVDISDEIIAAAISKRGVAVEIEDKRFASLFAPINLTRANHYWTRKRGRDKETTSGIAWEVYYTLYPTKALKNSITVNEARKKRETLVRLNKVSSRFKRDVKVDDTTENTLMPKENITDELPKPFGHSHDRMNIDGNSHVGHKEKKFNRRFGRKLSKCCTDETDFLGVNQTLLSAKAQCLIDTRKSRKNFSDSEDTIEGDGEFYNMFSCERIKRWKTVVTCTIDCIAQKVGMFDSNGVINVDVAKRVVIENFARQEWESDASDDLVEKCSKITMASESKAVDAFGFHCNSKAAEFVYCMWRELFLICPADKQQNSKQCEKMRSVLKKFDENKFKN